MITKLIGSEWENILRDELNESYFKELKLFLDTERRHKCIYPKEHEVFNALELTPFSNVKVIIIGQDPYHGMNQAHGLSFSVNYGIKPPPSLLNIFKELQQDVGFQIPKHGNLTKWAKQGVLLLNSTLTVCAGEPASHKNKGWERFTDHIIKIISDKKENCVFLLWGNFAKEKQHLINTQKHFILTAAHPSPLARKGFIGCKHFSETNNFLASKNILPINWQLPLFELF